MVKLSKSEEKVLGYLWQLKRAYLKEIIECYPSPPPATTTIATLLKRMIDKGVVAFELHGKSRQYYPLIPKNAYFQNQLGNIVNQFFNNSPVQFASFFTKENDFSKEQLEELRRIINQQIKDLK